MPFPLDSTNPNADLTATSSLRKRAPGERIGLAMSGGGFRSTLFQLGSAWRLHDLGLLERISILSAVSGGAITAAWTAYRWAQLHSGAADFGALVAAPLLEFTSQDLDPVEPVDLKTYARGVLTPLRTQRWQLRLASLFGEARLADIPAGAPLLLIQSANIATGGGVYMSPLWVDESMLGRNLALPAEMSLVQALAASSAYPSWFMPVEKHSRSGDWQALPAEAGGLPFRPYSEAARRTLVRRHGDRLLLVDGGMFDNLGVSALWDSVDYLLISDAAVPLRPGMAENLAGFFVDRMQQRLLGLFGRAQKHLRQLALEQFRVSQFVSRALHRTALAIDCIDQYHPAHRERLRGRLEDLRRQAERALPGQARGGAYWSVRSQLEHFDDCSARFADSAVTGEFASTPTSLNSIPPERQRQLVNWGYLLADCALRSQFDPGLPAAGTLPYPEVPM